MRKESAKISRLHSFGLLWKHNDWNPGGLSAKLKKSSGGTFDLMDTWRTRFLTTRYLVALRKTMWFCQLESKLTKPATLGKPRNNKRSHATQTVHIKFSSDTESIEWGLSCGRMIRLLAHPLSPPSPESARWLSFSVFLCVAGWAYWRKRRGERGPGREAKSYEKAWPSHTILSGLTPSLSSGLLREPGGHGRRRGARLHRLHVPHGGIWPPLRPLLLSGQLKSVLRIRIRILLSLS